ncbi:MAG: hypothetical protein J6B04_00590 [Clostridia bacterium]|nr:hypothetical protein [Clostridia bacterium]
MTEEKARKLRLIYATALGVFTVIVGALFIMQTLRIYGMGDKPFSREIVAEKLSQIAIPVFYGLRR